MAQENFTSPDSNKSSVPRRKQTFVTSSSQIKTNSTTSPPSSTGSSDSLTFSYPKKSSEVTVSPNSPKTPVSGLSQIVPIALNTPLDKKDKPTTKEAAVPKPQSSKKNDSESKTSTNENQKASSSSSSSSASGSSSLSQLQVTPVVEEIKLKRIRVRTNLYQCPTPELVLATRMSVSDARKSSGNTADKLIIFFADEFLAVRNDEGSFFMCQCVQNMYRTSKKCRVRWLNKIPNSDDTYEISFYEQIDKECILTSLGLEDSDNKTYKLTRREKERIDNILKKSLDVEKGILPRPVVTEENPDGLDISLYKSESQLYLKATDSPSLKRRADSSSKSVPSAENIKRSTEKSTGPTTNQRKSNSSSKSSNQSKKKKVAPQSKSKDVAIMKSTSTGSKPRSTSKVDSNAGSARKKADKIRKEKKSLGSSKDSPLSSPEPQRTLRARSKK